MFYSTAFILGLVGLIYEGYKRSFPILPWILLLTFSRILLVIGSKIFTFSGEEWRYMFDNAALLPTSEKVLYGGLLFWGAGLFIGKHWLNFKPQFLDAFAIVVPLSFSFMRLGCFFNGCCYGKASVLPWAVQYPVNSLPHFHHYGASLIGNTETFSLPVHPVQLYEFFGIAAIFFIVLHVRARWKSNGSSFLFMLILYAAVRFVAEFFRDPMAHTTGGTMIGWMNQTQWVILILLPAAIFLLFYRERVNPATKKVAGENPSLPRMIGLLTISAFLIWIFKNWFTRAEIFTLLVVFITAIAFTVRFLFLNYRQLRVRFAYLLFLLLPFLFMSQTLPETKNDSAQIRKTTSVGIGFGTGNFDNYVNVGTGEGCDRVSQTGYFNHKYTQAAVGLNFTNYNLTSGFETNYGVNFSGGNYTENKYNSPSGSTEFIWGINPYVKHDSRFFGIGGGLIIGNIGFAYENIQREGNYTPETGRGFSPVFPQFYIRIGPRDFVFLDYHFADLFPSSLPGYKHQIGIGSNLNSDNGFLIRAGTSFHGYYLTAVLPVKNISVEPLLHLNQSIYYNRNSIYFNNTDTQYEDAGKYDLQFSVSIRYNFGGKTVMRPSIKSY
jgi:phosphatidylglycerol:prolipoprotein diacylglycerol transferase